MTRKIKGLGLAFVAIAAMSMVGAGSVQASELHATIPAKASIFGQQITTHPDKFQTTAGQVQCAQSQLEGTVNNSGPSQQQTTANELTLTATYSTCQGFGQAATIRMNGCKYTVTSQNQTTANPHTTNLTAWIDVSGCTTGKSIEVITGICTITVPQQQHLSHIVFKNISGAAPHDVEATATVTGIKYENHGVLCPNYGGLNTQTRTDGQFIGATTLRATEDTGDETVTKHNHHYFELKQNGPVVGLLAT